MINDLRELALFLSACPQLDAVGLEGLLTQYAFSVRVFKLVTDEQHHSNDLVFCERNVASLLYDFVFLFEHVRRPYELFFSYEIQGSSDIVIRFF